MEGRRENGTLETAADASAIAAETLEESHIGERLPSSPLSAPASGKNGIKEENGKTYKNIKMKARTNLNKVNLFGKFISFLSF